MAAAKLNRNQLPEFKALVARMTSQGSTPTEIADAWAEGSETYGIAPHPDLRVTPENVHYHLRRARREFLASETQDTGPLTDAIVTSLACQALIDASALFEWKDGKVQIKDSADLTAAEMSVCRIEIWTDGDGKKSSKVTYDPADRTAAAAKLLSFFHGSKLTVLEPLDFVERLRVSGDRVGLDLVAKMASNRLTPEEIMSQRASHLAVFDLLSSSGDAEGVQLLRDGGNAIAVLRERAPFLALPETVDGKEGEE